MKQPILGRGDLIRSLAGRELSDRAMMLLGFEPPDAEHGRDAHLGKDQQGEQRAAGDESSQSRSSEARNTRFEPLPTQFWRLETLEIADQDDAKSTAARIAVHEPPRGVVQPDDPTGAAPAIRLLEWLPLATSAELRNRVRHLSALRRATDELDVPAAVERIARETVVFDLPRRQDVALGRLHVVEDRAEHLIPYWMDQDLVSELLRTFYPAEDLRIFRIGPGRNRPTVRWPRQAHAGDGWPRHGESLLVLGDLGCLIDKTENWIGVGRRMRRQSSAAMALVPCRSDDVPEEVRRWWQVIPWESPGATTEGRTLIDADQLAALMAITIRLEPGLLRAVRRRLPGGAGNPGLESRVWSHRAVGSPHPLAATWNPERLDELRESLASMPREYLVTVWEEIDKWHASLSASIGHAELVALDCVDRNLRQQVVSTARWQSAVQYLHLASDPEGKLPDQRKDWFSLLTGWMPGTVHDTELREALSKLVDCVRPLGPLATIPSYYVSDHDELPAFRTFSANQQGDRLTFIPRSDQSVEGEISSGHIYSGSSPVALITSKSSHWTLESDRAIQRFPGPPWASEFDRDKFGYYAWFRVHGVAQRMRWVPPGSFLMGSPDSEGGDPDERPQHRVVLSRGFWIFDTPCTQALWRAVMEENPSKFRGDHRPVDSVSWEDVQQFLSRMSDPLPALRLTLPTEAQWEYACRAGTQEARYGELDDVAWHGGNSNGQTHSVGQKAANDWGLYDMLGNVFEWCQDHAYRTYQDREELDPVFEKGGANAFRVIRGGSWGSSPQGVRAAFRLAYRLGSRWDARGFRAVSSGEPGIRSGAGPHRIDAERSGAEPVAVPAQLIDWTRAAGSVSVALPARPVVRIHPRRGETWTLARIEPPMWATQMGRDSFGLWAEFMLENVTQRMRWIPPGRFRMGSPPEDSERFEGEMELHWETVEQGFWIFDTPCRQVLWKTLRSDNRSRFQGDDRPVENVTWDESMDFLRHLGERIGLPLELPTEKQWEYACRAGSEDSRYGELDAIAWHAGNSGSQTHDVASKEPNSWGLYDMLGNVYEWCLDGWEANTAVRVIRGGSWSSLPRWVRAAFRDALHPGDRWDRRGFRAVSSGEPGREGEAGPSRIAAERSGAETRSVPAEPETGARRGPKRTTRESRGGSRKRRK